MIPVTQTKLHIEGKQNGNCMNAAIASILEVPLENIPEFENMREHGQGTPKNPSWWVSLQNWLKNLGYQLIIWDSEKSSPFIEGYYIANGPSPRGFEHSVVYHGGSMVHDPHPSRAGILEIKSIWAFLPHDPSKNHRRKDGG